MADLKEVFKAVFVRKVPEEVNEIIFALSKWRSTDLTLSDEVALPDSLTSNLTTLQRIVRTNQETSDGIQKLTYKLANLTML